MKVVHRPLDAVILGGDLANYSLKILKDQPAGYAREAGMETLDIVTQAAANVNQQGAPVAVVEAVEQPVLHGVESLVEPRWPPVRVAAHVVVEVGTTRRVGMQPVKHVLFRVEGVLEGADTLFILGT